MTCTYVKTVEEKLSDRLQISWMETVHLRVGSRCIAVDC